MVNGEGQGCAKYGETCNPSARKFCCIGLSCKPQDRTKLGGPGKCVAENEIKEDQGCAKYGETCNQSARIFCCRGLACKPEDPTKSGSPGKCVAIN